MNFPLFPSKYLNVLLLPKIIISLINSLVSFFQAYFKWLHFLVFIEVQFDLNLNYENQIQHAFILKSFQILTIIK